MGSVEDVSRLLIEWQEADGAGRDVTPILTKLAEIFEIETQAFLKQNPDPFDDRHPSRSQPDCTLGHILKSVFRNQRLVDEMVKVYCQRDVVELNTAVCRFLLNILPGLESVIFQEEGFVVRLFQWAENAPNPLQSYATGLLAAAMDVPEIASSYREKNAHFVPLMLRRLYELSKLYLQPKHSHSASGCDIFPFSFGYYPEKFVEDKSCNPVFEDSNKTSRKVSKKRKDGTKSRYSPIFSETKSKARKSLFKVLKIPPVDESAVNEASNSNWTQYMYGSYQVFPLTLAAQQRYILQYLTPMGEYQELIGHVFEENALSLILQYADLCQNHDVRLAFEALKYLASLLCHKKISLEFLNMGGLQLLLKVPLPSIAATGTSLCLYYLGYLEDSMEKICLSPPSVISDLVSYALWLLECSHDSSRCHATLFCSFGFAFKVFLHHFDQQDGLRKLFNVMSTLEIFVSQNGRTLNDDDMFANRLQTRHVCTALKRYFEAHLSLLVEQKQHLFCRKSSFSKLDLKDSKASSLTQENVERNMEMLREWSLTPLFDWQPVNEFVHLDGVTFLLELISSYFELSYSGRADTVKNAVDVLKICALSAPAALKFCEKISSPEYLHITGISVLLQAAEGDMMAVAEAQRSALLTIVNCVCSKLPSAESSSRSSSTPKKKIRNVEEVLTKLWKAVRIKNGIIILINLLAIKSPLTDADSIRALACKALCGLARSETVKQIISKLPLVTNGQLIDLMKEPVLQDKYHDHVQFCKYGIELIERVTGAPLSAGSEPSMNLNKICVSEVVAKTKVVYHEAQLLQLICDHLTQKGFNETVACLRKEMEEKLGKDKPQQIREACPSIWRSASRAFYPVDKPSKFSSMSSSTTGALQSIPPPSVPLKIVLNKKVQSPDIRSPPYRLQKPQVCSGNYVQSPAFSKMKRQSVVASYKSSQSTISLDSIVTEYLRKQHSLCKNPMLACPPFDLYIPHKCPEPHFKRNAPVNYILRLQKREVSFHNGGYRGAAFNRKHIYSRFRLHRTCRDEEGRCDFTVCAFFNCEEPVPKILVGTASGKVKVFNVNTAKHILCKDCHFRGLSHIETRQSSPLLITSDGGRIGNSSLWNFTSDIDLIHNFTEVPHMEFGKRSLERIVGTKHDSAVIYDTSTFVELQTFPVGDLGNNYLRNTATFDFRDELVLTDGLIYDVRSGKMLHKLDKFNSTRNGVFHPNGREIISNTEIWDIRTFKLLRTVAGLDQCRVTFNQPGSVIYAVTFHNKAMEVPSCFSTFDAFDYNSISTVDVKKSVCHLATDLNDRFIATIEGISGVECVCRLYEVGRTKQLGDENGDESEDSDDETEEDEEEEEDNEGPTNEVPFEGGEENDDDDEEESTWIATSDSSDDEETLFSLNTSMED